MAQSLEQNFCKSATITIMCKISGALYLGLLGLMGGR